MANWHSALRLGSTSCVYPEDVLPNVRKLCGLVQNIEWDAFEVSYGVPGPEVFAEMARLGAAYRHSYTVHLPLDLRLAAQDEGVRRRSLDDARLVIAAVRAVEPWAYVVHVEAEADTGEAWGPWHERAAASLGELAAEAGDARLLAIENLENYPPEHLWRLAERLPVSLCLDVGHLLRQGREPLLPVEAQLERSRVIHLHGCENGRDHRSLAAMDQGVLLGLLRLLHRRQYRGVVTIECFGPEPFFESWDLVEGLWRRVGE